MKRFLVVLIPLALPGCALLKTHDADTPEVVQVSAPAGQPASSPVGSPDAIRPASAILSASPPTDATQSAPVSGTWDRSDLDDFDAVVIRLPHADVSVSTGASRRHGRVHVEKLHGDRSCAVDVVEGEDVLRIQERPEPSAPGAKLSAFLKNVKSSIPSVPRCRFAVDLALHEAAELDVQLTRGSVLIEKWDEPIKVQMTWGDIDVGSVHELSVSCAYCTLAGDGVDGPLRYVLERGNVGLAGVSGSVDGQTEGDMILKWKRIRPRDAVKLVSRAGDVILFFPAGTPLAMDLRAPRGEVFAKPRSDTGGVPVSVTADVGNVRFLRAAQR